MECDIISSINNLMKGYEKYMNILIVDAQGGGVGKQLVTAVKEAMPEAKVIAVGANSMATGQLLKAGADEAATGENPVIVACRKADVIMGPIGIVIADSMNGEITPKMATAIGQSECRRILIPINNCNNIVAGVEDKSLKALIKDAVRCLQEGCTKS